MPEHANSDPEVEPEVAAALRPHLGPPTTAERIRAILAEHGLVPLDALDDTVRRIMLVVNERNLSGGW